MEELVEERLNTIVAMPIDSVSLLPAFARDEVTLDGKRIAIATYHETLENGNHRIIVQASRERWGGITAKVIVSGYELTNAGTPRKLRDDELYDYT